MIALHLGVGDARVFIQKKILHAVDEIISRQANEFDQQFQFRHDPRNQFVSDYISNAMVEKNQIVNIEVLFEGKAGAKKSVLKDDAN